MFWTAGPALGISLVLFLIIGLNAEPSGASSTEAAEKALEGAFNISPWNLLPLLLLVLFSIRKFPPFLSILGSALFAGILACFTQWTAVQAFVAEPGARSGRHRRQGDLRRDGDGVREQHRERGDRSAVLARGDGEPADDRLARARCALVRRRRGARGIPRPLAQAGRRARTYARQADPGGRTRAGSAST